MKKLILTVFPLAFIAAASFVFYSCSCGCGNNSENTIPKFVVDNADEFIISRTSKDYFEKYIKFDASKTQKNILGYNLVYKFFIPEKPFVDVLIQLYADTLGKINTDRGVIGIPNCLSNPPECDFAIDEKKAAQIATEAGLEPGIKEWKKMFVWSDKHGRYTWVVLSTFEEAYGTNGFRGKGRELVIDATTGSVIDNKEWFIR